MPLWCKHILEYGMGKVVGDSARQIAAGGLDTSWIREGMVVGSWKELEVGVGMVPSKQDMSAKKRNMLLLGEHISWSNIPGTRALHISLDRMKYPTVANKVTPPKSEWAILAGSVLISKLHDRQLLGNMPSSVDGDNVLYFSFTQLCLLLGLCNYSYTRMSKDSTQSEVEYTKTEQAIYDQCRARNTQIMYEVIAKVRKTLTRHSIVEWDKVYLIEQQGISGEHEADDSARQHILSAICYAFTTMKVDTENTVFIQNRWEEYNRLVLKHLQSHSTITSVRKVHKILFTASSLEFGIAWAERKARCKLNAKVVEAIQLQREVADSTDSSIILRSM